MAYMVRENMPHASKQIAAAVLHDPALARDKIDGTYYTKVTSPINPMGTTQEAVQAEDPIYAFMALRETGIPMQDLKIYSELVSLVHALGSRESSVREFALAELVKLKAADPNFAASQDYVGAIVHFLNHRDRSVRYRAVLAAWRHPQRRVIQAMIPMVTDHTSIYSIPDALGFSPRSRSIGSTVSDILVRHREEYQEDLKSMLSHEDYLLRYAGAKIFSGTRDEAVRSILARLATEDEYKVVRDAASSSLGLDAPNSQGPTLRGRQPRDIGASTSAN